jgi:hypothetical protein
MFKQKIALLVAACMAALGTTLTFAPAASASSVWDAVAQCESSGNWADNTGNGFYGGLQFTASTWTGYGGAQYASSANLASKSEQIAIAQKVLAGQGPGAWPVCSIKGGLTASNGGTSSAEPVVARATVSTYVGQRLVVDGIIGPLTRQQMADYYISFATVGDIMFWQGKFGVTQDGIVGPITAMALQRYINTL